MKFKLGASLIALAFFVNSSGNSYQAEQNNIQLVVSGTTTLLNEREQRILSFYTLNIKPIEIAVTNKSNNTVMIDPSKIDLTLEKMNILRNPWILLIGGSLAFSLLTTIASIDSLYRKQKNIITISCFSNKQWFMLSGFCTVGYIFMGLDLFKILKKIQQLTLEKSITIKPDQTVKKIVLVKKNNVKNFTLTLHDQDTNEATMFEVNLTPAR